MKNTTYITLDNYCDRKSFYNKCFVELYDGIYTLYSYNTPICSYNPQNDAFKRLYYGYTVTTMRHINAFMDYIGIRAGGKAFWDNLYTYKAYSKQELETLYRCR